MTLEQYRAKRGMPCYRADLFDVENNRYYLVTFYNRSDLAPILIYIQNGMSINDMEVCNDTPTQIMLQLVHNLRGELCQKRK